MPERDQEIGKKALALLRDKLMIDAIRTTEHERGYSWIAQRLRQVAWESGPIKKDGFTVARLIVKTTVVKDVTAPQGEVWEALAMLNANAVGSGYGLLPDRTIAATLAVTIYEQILASRVMLLASYQILQLCEAEAIGEQLARQLGGELALEESLSRDAVPDDMLNVEHQILRPAGATESRFAVDEEMQTVVNYVADSPYASLGGTRESVCVEVAFGDNDTTLIELRPLELHPTLGSGLAVTTSLPIQGERSQLVKRASELGALQVQPLDGGALLGGWGIRTKRDVPLITFCRFVPNALFAPGIALDAVVNEISRALWVDRLLFPGLPNRSAWPIIERRANFIERRLKTKGLPGA